MHRPNWDLVCSIPSEIYSHPPGPLQLAQHPAAPLPVLWYFRKVGHHPEMAGLLLLIFRAKLQPDAEP